MKRALSDQLALILTKIEKGIGRKPDPVDFIVSSVALITFVICFCVLLNLFL